MEQAPSYNHSVFPPEKIREAEEEKKREFEEKKEEFYDKIKASLDVQIATNLRENPYATKLELVYIGPDKYNNDTDKSFVGACHQIAADLKDQGYAVKTFEIESKKVEGKIVINNNYSWQDRFCIRLSVN